MTRSAPTAKETAQVLGALEERVGTAEETVKICGKCRHNLLSYPGEVWAAGRSPNVKDKEAQELGVQDGGRVGWVVYAILFVENGANGGDEVAWEVERRWIGERGE